VDLSSPEKFSEHLETCLTRRAFLGRAAAAGAASLPLTAGTRAESSTADAEPALPFLNVLRPPDRVAAYCGPGDGFALSRAGERWTGRSVQLETSPAAEELPIRLSAPRDAVTHVHLRWAEGVGSSLLCLGDAWERSYGDLAWRSLVPERPMPWYFATSTLDGRVTHGYGVKTGAGALCFWQLDPEGVSLWLDVSNGGGGVLLGERTLDAATVVSYPGGRGEDPVAAVRRLCQRMCAKPRASIGPVYGSNDWYYAYGNSSQEAILRDADLVASLQPVAGPKPFTVVDEGWANKAKFPDMTKLAVEIRRRGVRPGIWERPLRAPVEAPPALLMPAARFGERSSRAAELAYDPTIPAALQLVTEKLRAIRSWGYELLKHDFSTYDLLGQWGFEMGARPTLPGWSFHDRSRTNAEIMSDLYRAIRLAAGEETVILGCNTVGHLTAGIFDLQRTGDDTSGKLWERTRRMGVNTLAFRTPQHGSFFSIDADCVAITGAVPWELTRQWLEVVARSGTALFVSAEAPNQEQKKALREAFATVTAPGASSAPVDWFHDTTPESWLDQQHRSVKQYSWCAPDGADPFGV
jgi:alpha-galactosidase